MSLEKNKKGSTDSPHVFNYLRELIPLEDIKEFASPRRINSIDFVKGFAIIFIILAHSSGIWLNSENYYLYGILFMWLDILGPALFVFLSALSVVFSVRKKQGIQPEKLIRIRIFSRGVIIIIIGMLYNIFALTLEGISVPFPLTLWGWNILTFIGFTQIFSYYALKLSKLLRAIIGILIIMFSNTIRDFILTPYLDSNIVIKIIHFIIISPNPMVPLLPALSISFISTIFGEYLYEAMNRGTKDAYTGLFRIYLVWGIIFVILGISTGYTLYTPETIPGGLAEYPHVGLLYAANGQPFIRIPGMFEFLIRGRGPNMWYNLGAALLIIAVSFYFIDLHNKNNNFIKILIYYGKVSLSLFFVHQIYLGLFIRQFNILLFFIVFFGYAGIMGFLMYIWMEFANGVGSPEWLMVVLGKIGTKPTKK